MYSQCENLTFLLHMNYDLMVCNMLQKVGDQTNNIMPFAEITDLLMIYTRYFNSYVFL